MLFEKSPQNNHPAKNSRSGFKDIHQTKIWQQSCARLKQFWNNYLNVLSSSFLKMPRTAQEDLISRFSLITTMGVATLLLLFFSPFIPQFIRIFAVPGTLVAAWWIGKNLVSPAVIARFSQLLNRDI